MLTVRAKDYEILIHYAKEARRSRTPGLSLIRTPKGLVIKARNSLTDETKSVIHALNDLLAKKYPMCMEVSDPDEVVREVYDTMPGTFRSTNIERWNILQRAYKRLVKKGMSVKPYDELWRHKPSGKVLRRPEVVFKPSDVKEILSPVISIPLIKKEEAKAPKRKGPWIPYYKGIERIVKTFIEEQPNGYWKKVPGEYGMTYPLHDMDYLVNWLEEELSIPKEMSRATNKNTGGREIKHKIHLAMMKLKAKGELEMTSDGIKIAENVVYI